MRSSAPSYQPRRYGWAPHAPYKQETPGGGRSAPGTGTLRERRERLARERTQAFARRLRKEEKGKGGRPSSSSKMGNPVPIKAEEFRERRLEADEKLLGKMEQPLGWHRHEELRLDRDADAGEDSGGGESEEIDAEKLVMRQRKFRFCFTYDEWCFLQKAKQAVDDVQESSKRESEKQSRTAREALAQQSFREWVASKAQQQKARPSPAAAAKAERGNKFVYTPSSWKEDKLLMLKLQQSRTAPLHGQCKNTHGCQAEGEARKKAADQAYREWLAQKSRQKKEEEKLKAQVNSVLQVLKETQPSKWSKKDIVPCYTYASIAAKDEEKTRRKQFIERMRHTL
jgi:predicted acetyltransferase